MSCNDKSGERAGAPAGGLSPERRQAIQERAEKATEGPWVQDVLLVRDDENGVLRTIAHCTRWYNAQPRPEEAEANAEFIAHARQDIPDLLAEVSRLTAALEERDKTIEQLVEQLHAGLADYADAKSALAQQAEDVTRLKAALEAVRRVTFATHQDKLTAFIDTALDPGAALASPPASPAQTEEPR